MIRLRDKMQEDLELRGFRATTVEAYLRCARRFVEYFNLPPSKLGASEVRRYGLYLLREAGVSASTVNVYAAAIRFLYCVTLKRPEACQFAASCRHLKADFCRVMPPPHLQADAATSTRG